jgi:hypothetical protein
MDAPPPRLTATEPLDSPRAALPGKLSARSRVLHGAAFVIGLSLFAWAVSLAFSGSNQAALAKLRALPAATLAGLVGLTMLSLLLNGLMFWVTARPLWQPQGGVNAQPIAKALPLGETLAINCIATLLSLLPFKLGLLVRSTLHVRRHGVAIPSLLAWFVAFGVMTLVVAALAGGIAAARGMIDWWWLALVVAGVAGLALVAEFVAPWLLGFVMMLGTLLSRGRGGSAPGTPVAMRFMQLISPLSIIASRPETFLAHASLRVLDFGTFAARFALLAGALGVALSPEHALLLGSTFLLLNALAPAGSLGFAEMGVAGAGALVGLPPEQIVLLSLLTTALQSVVAGALGGAGWLWMMKRTPRRQPS